MTTYIEADLIAANDMQPFFSKIKGCTRLSPVSGAAITSCWCRQAATTCPSSTGTAELVASASQPAQWRMSSSVWYTAQALQNSDLLTANPMLSRDGHC